MANNENAIEMGNIQINNNEILMSIVGQFDQNLKDLSKLTKTEIFCRGLGNSNL